MEPDHQTKAGQVKGIQTTDYLNWKHHPVTRVFHQYLKDRVKALEAQCLDYLLGARVGARLDPEVLAEIAGRIKSESEIPELDFDAVIEFYQTMEEDNGTEAV